MHVLKGTLKDARAAARTLLRSPAYALATAGVLAIGVGAATAAFTILDRALVRPLPYPDEGRLVTVYESDGRGAVRLPSHPVFRDWLAGARSLEGIAYVRGTTLGVRGGEGSLLLLASYATADLFALLGATPALGRVPGAQDGDQPVAVLAWHTWRDQFGADPAIVGRLLSTEHGPVEIVGVMPEEVRYPAWTDVWLPIGSLPPPLRATLEQRDFRADARVVARVGAHTSLASAAAELGVIGERIAAVHADARGWSSVSLVPVRDELVGRAPGRMLGVGGAAVLLLLLAGFNVAGLFVARAAARQRELAVRAALGAGRTRLVGPLIAEALILTAGGVLAGTGLAVLLVKGLAAAAPDALPRLTGAAVDARALGVALLVSTGLAVAFATVTVRRARRVSPMHALRGARGTAGGAGVERLRTVLVVAQVALATVLTVGAASFLHALLRLDAVDLGADPQGVVVVRINPPAPRYATPEAALALYRRLEEAARAVPGVRAAALINHVPFGGMSMPTPVRTSRVPGPDEGPVALYRAVTADYFAALGVAFEAGRPLTTAEVDAGAPVAVVNAALAAREWPDRDPIGQTVTVRRVAQGRPDFGAEMTLTVVGVVTSIRTFGPAGPSPPAVYVPYTVSVWSSTFVVARGDGDTRVLAAALRRALLQVDDALPIAGPGFTDRVRPLDDYVANWLRADRTGSRVATGIALAALVLAAVGLFGVVSYLVLQRDREFGVRLALGASPASIMGLVLRQGARLAALGLGLGFATTLLAARGLAAARDALPAPGPAAFLQAAAVFGAAVLLACAAPAARAARVPPATVLRDDT